MRSSRPLRAVFLGGLVVVAIVIATTVALIAEFRARELKDARRELFNLNAALAEEASRAIQSVDLVLGNLIDGFKLEGIEETADLVRLESGWTTHQLLKARISGLQQLAAVTLIGADGNLIASSREFPAPPLNLSDRDYFVHFSRTNTDAPFVSEPVESRGTGAWTVYIVRRLSGSRGQFAGLVLGAIDLRYFEKFYRSLELGRGMAVSLWRQDGTLLARYPAFETVGRRVATPGFAELTPAAPPIIYEVAKALDGQARLNSRRVLGEYPVVVIVSRSLESILTDWRRQSVLIGILGSLVVIATLAAMAALARQFLAYEDLAEAVRGREAAILAREAAESQLRQSQKLETMGQLTSGVAHDFNNLLTIVLGNLDILSKRLSGADPKVARHLAGAQGGADRAAALARRLLAFSRRETLEPSPIDVAALVDAMADLLRQTLGDGIGLDLRLPPNLPPVFADGGQLEGAILNLVVNARDAMPQGGEVTIEVRCVAQEKSLEIVVTDTGTGMAPEVLGRAFEPFFTTKGPGVGTGLGLAQVHGFVTQSGGEVNVASEPGRGTAVTLRLPCLDATSQGARRVDPKPRVAAGG